MTRVALGQWIVTAMTLGAGGAVTYGVFQWSKPAGWVVLGLMIFGLAITTGIALRDAEKDLARRQGS
ncbi:MAG TPA: hypothetical protein VJL07_02655 [Dehalococcoidia bacterium]|nr:hypothetical protein [Dehalococcoidia bacterium]